MDWINNNSDAILAGIISSGIVVLLQVFINTFSQVISYLITNRLRLHRVLRMKNGETIYVTSGIIPNLQTTTAGGATQPIDRAATIKGPDSKAANLIIHTLQDIYEESVVRHIYTGQNDKVQTSHENIFTIGGPKYNATTKLFMSHLPDEVKFEQSGKLKVYDKEYTKDTTNNVDYGLIAKIKNPYMDGKYIYIVGGCGTYGVLAASYAISNQKYFPKLKKQLLNKMGWFWFSRRKEFVAVIKCETNNNEVGNPKIELLKKF